MTTSALVARRLLVLVFAMFLAEMLGRRSLRRSVARRTPLGASALNSTPGFVMLGEIATLVEMLWQVEAEGLVMRKVWIAANMVAVAYLVAGQAGLFSLPTPLLWVGRVVLVLGAIGWPVVAILERKRARLDRQNRQLLAEAGLEDPLRH